MSAIARLRDIASQHLAGGFSSRVIYVGDKLFDQAVTESVASGRPGGEALNFFNVEFRPISEQLRGDFSMPQDPDAPLSERGFGV